jgi:hypothetical protein
MLLESGGYEFTVQSKAIMSGSVTTKRALLVSLLFIRAKPEVDFENRASPSIYLNISLLELTTSSKHSILLFALTTMRMGGTGGFDQKSCAHIRRLRADISCARLACEANKRMDFSAMSGLIDDSGW